MPGHEGRDAQKSESCVADDAMFSSLSDHKQVSSELLRVVVARVALVAPPGRFCTTTQHRLIVQDAVRDAFSVRQPEQDGRWSLCPQLCARVPGSASVLL